MDLPQEKWVQSLGWEDPLEEGMATHSSILAWGIPMDRLSLAGYSPHGRKESDMTEQLSTAQQVLDCSMQDLRSSLRHVESLVSACDLFYLWHEGSSSLTRDGTQAPYIGSIEF